MIQRFRRDQFEIPKKSVIIMIAPHTIQSDAQMSGWCMAVKKVWDRRK